jgi:hypothetical protein
MDSYRLYALAFHNLDLFFSQSVKLVDQGVICSKEGMKGRLPPQILTLSVTCVVGSNPPVVVGVPELR